MRRPFLLLLVCFMFVFALGQSAWAFKDTGSSPNADKIAALQAAGIISGEAEDMFNPKGKLTYAAGVTMIVNGLDLSLARFLFNKAPKASDFFTNVKDDAWYSDAFVIAQVNELDIPKDVKPQQAMTREQFAHHLFRGIQATGPYSYIEPFVLLKDEGDVTPAYMNSIQKLHITGIVHLDQNQKFHPKAEMTRGEAAGWLHDAIKFIKEMAETPQPEPQPNPLTDVKLEIKSVNQQVNQVTITAQAPHPGYGIRISSIVFSGKQAVIYTEPVLPDPDTMYPQVITAVKTVTYVGSGYEPVIAESAWSDSVYPEANNSGSGSAAVQSAQAI